MRDLLDHVGLGASALTRYPHEFSGGQRQRISIARALASRPRILICDEPTSALDVSIQAQIVNLLKDLQDELGLTMPFISHELPVIRQVCYRVAVMKGGQICECTDVDELFENPSHEYAKQLLHQMPRLDLLSQAKLLTATDRLREAASERKSKLERRQAFSRQYRATSSWVANQTPSCPLM